ncbi:hydrogenase small subunit [Desulforapulum autotrophicum]|nr:hydrogenase small subunit [Desulforapulum autotrophicum]
MKETEEKSFYERLEGKGVSRRDFLKYCTVMTASMGLSASCVGQVASSIEKAASGTRPSVVWLHFGECTGCSEAFLRTPNVGAIILETISVEYHETIMAASGHQAEKSLEQAIKTHKGKFICVVEGSIATAYNGAYGKVGGRTFLEIANDVIPKAAVTIALGTCAAYGGIPSAAPNPGGYKGVKDAIGVATINISGCPPNPLNLLSTIVKYLNKETIELDELGRPLFAYAETVHDRCPRLKHFENDEFVEEFGSKEAELGYCLYHMGCKGPETYNNCPTAKFNDGTSFPIQAGHPCIGCSEPDFWDTMTPFYEEY